MRHARRLTRVFPVLAILGLMLLAGSPADATFPGTNGRIAFDDWITGQTYAVNPDGTGLVQLTHVNVDAGQFSGDPAWSPDGAHIAYETNKSGEVRLWIMDADGSNKHIVTHGRPNTFDLLPVYTPDGTRLVYQQFRRYVFQDETFFTARIYSISIDGTDRRGLTAVKPPTEVFDFDPAVSPDGQSVVFSRSNRNYDGLIRQLYVMGIDGSNAHAVSPPELEGWFPDWSPNGNRVVFTDNSDRVGHNGYVMNIDGTNVQQLTTQAFPHSDSQFQYSPDGTRMVFASDRNVPCCSDLFVTSDLFVMNADGTDQTLIETGLTAVHDFAWGTAPTTVTTATAPTTDRVGAALSRSRLAARCSALPAPFRVTEGCASIGTKEGPSDR